MKPANTDDLVRLRAEFEAREQRLAGSDVYSLLIPRIFFSSSSVSTMSLNCHTAMALIREVFDLVLQYTVFSSILDEKIKANLTREMLRVVKPRGMILWCDFWLNPMNKQTRGTRSAEIRPLFPVCTFEFHRITLAPALTRRLAPISWLACSSRPDGCEGVANPVFIRAEIIKWFS